MESNITKLSNSFHLDIDAPFLLRVSGKDHQFQCRIRGYGAKHGIIIDKDWEKISPLADDLVTMGFAFSCFDIDESEAKGFQELLDDWGRN